MLLVLVSEADGLSTAVLVDETFDVDDVEDRDSFSAFGALVASGTPPSVTILTPSPVSQLAGMRSVV